MDDADHMRELEARLADVKARLPRHSVPAAMMVEMEELEDVLALLHANARQFTEKREQDPR